MNSLNQEKVDEFTGRITQILVDANIGLMLSVGNRTGLIDAMVHKPPSSSMEIANYAKLNERYVREWLNGMVTARIIDYDADQKKYHLSNEHAQVISSEGGLGNMAFFMQTIKPLADVENEIVKCFEDGGGVSYDHPDGRNVLKVINNWTERDWDENLISTTLPSFLEIMTKLEKGINVLDLGCGYGHASNLMANNFPNSNFVGYDISIDGIAKANQEKTELGLINVNFAIQNVELMNEPKKYEFIIAFDSIHDQAKPAHVLKVIHDSLADNGIFLMVVIKASSNVEDNIDNPMGAWLYTVSTFHCLTVSLAANGEGLGTVWGWQKAFEMLKVAGFSNVEKKELESDPFNFYYVCKK